MMTFVVYMEMMQYLFLIFQDIHQKLENYVISKLKEARVSYYIINRTTGYKEEDKFISEDKEAFKRYLPEAKKYVLIKSKAEAVKFKIDKLLDYPDDAIEKLNKIERILEE